MDESLLTDQQKNIAALRKTTSAQLEERRQQAKVLETGLRALQDLCSHPDHALTDENTHPNDRGVKWECEICKAVVLRRGARRL